jgi:hypothetical protein
MDGMYPSFLRVAQNEGGWIGSGFEPTEKATTTDGIWGELGVWAIGPDVAVQK